MVDVVFIAQHLQHRLITSFHVVVVVATIGKMLSLHAISATISRQINHSKRWVGNFARFLANQLEQHGEFLELGEQIKFGCSI
jgi:hypothetical protein